jgi:ABC-type branched-subunit amino acid transport system ATPase component
MTGGINYVNIKRDRFQVQSSSPPWLDGVRIDTQPTKRIITQGFTIVPENRRIFPRMTVLENLELGA